MKKIEIGENFMLLAIVAIIVVACSDIGRPDNVILECPAEAAQ